MHYNLECGARYRAQFGRAVSATGKVLGADPGSVHGTLLAVSL